MNEGWNWIQCVVVSGLWPFSWAQAVAAVAAATAIAAREPEQRLRPQRRITDAVAWFYLNHFARAAAVRGGRQGMDNLFPVVYEFRTGFHQRGVRSGANERVWVLEWPQLGWHVRACPFDYDDTRPLRGHSISLSLPRNGNTICALCPVDGACPGRHLRVEHIAAVTIRAQCWC